MNKTKVLFDVSSSEMIARGFLTFGNGNWLHAQFPGMIFRPIEGFADAMANGAAFIMYGSTRTACVPSERWKMVFGADVGYHGYRDKDGNYPRLNQMPVHAALPYVVKGPGAGQRAWDQSGRCFANAIAKTIMKFEGVRWADHNADSNGAFCIVLSVVTRVPRGIIYRFNDSEWGINERFTQADIKAHPKNKVNLSADVEISNGPHGPSTGTGERLYTDYVDQGYIRNNSRFGGSGGVIFLTIDIDVRKFISDAKLAFLAGHNPDMRKEYEKAWDKAFAEVPRGSIPFAMPFIPVWPTAENPTLRFTPAVGRVPRAVSLLLSAQTEDVGPAGTVADSQPVVPDNCSIVTRLGQYPLGEQPTQLLPVAFGEPNADTWRISNGAYTTDIPEFSFYRVPDVELTNALGAKIAGSATIFGRLSPLTRPTGSKIPIRFDTLSEALDLTRRTGWKDGKMADGSLNEDDPMFLTKVQGRGEEIKEVLPYQLAEIEDLEPFSMELARFGGRLTKLVADQIGF